MDGIRECSQDYGRAGLSNATQAFAALDYFHLNGRSFAHAKRPIVVEVALLHATVLDRDLAVHGGRQAEVDAALHLGDDGVRVDDQAAVDDARNLVNLDLSLWVHAE